MDRFAHTPRGLAGCHRAPGGKPCRRRLALAVAACVLTAITASCGAVQGPRPGVPERTGATTPTASPAAGVSASCQNAVSAGLAGIVLIVTLAGDSKIYCLRAGDILRLVLRGTRADPWQRPLITGTALKPLPGSGSAAANGITGVTYVAAAPGQAGIVSVRPPCHIVFAPQEGGVQPRFRAVALSAGKSCSAGRFFSTSVDVLR